ncbi:MAG: hypothetical protein ABIV04_17500 [Massilia sp.]
MKSTTDGSVEQAIVNFRRDRQGLGGGRGAVVAWLARFHTIVDDFARLPRETARFPNEIARFSTEIGRLADEITRILQGSADELLFRYGTNEIVHFRRNIVRFRSKIARFRREIARFRRSIAQCRAKSCESAGFQCAEQYRMEEWAPALLRLSIPVDEKMSGRERRLFHLPARMSAAGGSARTFALPVKIARSGRPVCRPALFTH